MSNLYKGWYCSRTFFADIDSENHRCLKLSSAAWIDYTHIETHGDIILLFDVGAKAMKADDDAQADCDDDSDDPKLPDGGWGWVVTFACLTINIIYDGCSYSFGILFVEFLGYFRDTKRNTALIGSLFFSVPLLLGPIASTIVNKFGYRAGTMVGGVIAATGFALSSMANGTWMLCLTYGLLSGIGMSIPYLTASVAVTSYFRKRLALASGIAEMGAGLGTVIFAPFTEWLISEYGWRGTLLIISGVMANIAVCGALIFPIKSHDADVSINPLDTSDNERVKHSVDLDEEMIEMLPKRSRDDVKDTSGDTERYMYIAKRASARTDYSTHVDVNGDQDPNICSDRPPPIEEDAYQSIYPDLDHKTVHSNPSQILLVPNHPLLHRIRTSVCAYFTRMRSLACWPFILFTTSSFIMYFWYDVPYVFTVDRAIHFGVKSSNAAILLLLIGIVHAPGNLVYGFMGDRKWTNRMLLYGVSLVLCGVSMFLVPGCFSYWSMAVTAAGFGLFTSAQEALTPVILTEIVGQKKVNDAFGVIMFLEGVANLFGPFVAGLLCDVTGGFDTTFISSGVCVAAGGALCTVYSCREFLYRDKSETAENSRDL